MAVEKNVPNSKNVSSEVTRWTHKRQNQYDVEKMSLHGEKFWRSYPQKKLESSIRIQFCWWYSPRQKKQIDCGEKAPVERSGAKVKLRFDTIIKIRKSDWKRLSGEHNICFACIAAVTYSLVWAQKRLAWRRETTSIALPTDGNCSFYSITPLWSQLQRKTTQKMNRSRKMQLSRKNPFPRILQKHLPIGKKNTTQRKLFKTQQMKNKFKLSTKTTLGKGMKSHIPVQCFRRPVGLVYPSSWVRVKWTKVNE